MSSAKATQAKRTQHPTQRQATKPKKRVNMDGHPKRDRIMRELAEGRPLRDIAKRYDLTPSTIMRYRDRNALEPVLLRSEQYSTGEKIIGEIEATIDTTKTMLSACHEWLTDPDDPAKYTMAPRSDEIEVIYTECNGNGNEVRAKGKLQDLLARVAGGLDGDVVSVNIKQMDNRKLMLETIDRLQRGLDKLADIHGLIKDKPGTVVNIGFQLTQLNTLVLEATKGSPDIRARLVDGLARLAEEQRAIAAVPS